MPFVKHTLDHWFLLRAVKGASTIDHAAQEEGGAGFELFEDVEYFDGGVAWSIVKGKGQFLGQGASIDDERELIVVLSVALLDVGAGRSLVAVTPSV